MSKTEIGIYILMFLHACLFWITNLHIDDIKDELLKKLKDKK